MNNGTVIGEAYRRLYRAYGPQHWWPGETPWEICTGAVLTQNTSWTNVEKAIAGLKQEDALCPRRTLDIDAAELERLLQPSGFFRIKTVRLREAARWWLDNVDADDRPIWRGRSLSEFRRDLLAVKGIGPETADSILLYAFNQPVFVIDAYTRRIAVRHLGMATADRMDYHALQQVFMAALPSDAQLFNEYHALLVKMAKEHCRKAICRSGCPLNNILSASNA